jgi:transcription antitermination factor NusG
MNVLSNNDNWYAVYTKPRTEKKVHSLLLLKGFESYCPLSKIRKRYSDRYKVVEEPLFKSYVFVKFENAQKTEIRLTDGVVNFVYWLGKPAVIKQEEIDTIKKFLKEYDNVKVESTGFEVNQTVKITSGLLMDHTATIKKMMKHKVIAELKTIGFRLVAEIEKKDLIPT